MSSGAADGLLRGEDGVTRCWWADSAPDYRAYHDTEWGFPVAHTTDSRALARDLKARGWRFVGPTTVYAFMQAMGLVNDHLEGCEAHDRVLSARATLTPP